MLTVTTRKTIAVKYIPPSLSAIIFWLTNRQPDSGNGVAGICRAMRRVVRNGSGRNPEPGCLHSNVKKRGGAERLWEILSVCQKGTEEWIYQERSFERKSILKKGKILMG